VNRIDALCLASHHYIALPVGQRPIGLGTAAVCYEYVHCFIFLNTLQKYGISMKYRKDMGKKMLHLADYLKKRILFFDFSRIINNFADK
jgi:hypothetical protein